MSAFEHNTHDEEQSYTPASPVKRTLAWIGVVYMVILVTLITYFYFTASILAVVCWLLALLTLPIGIAGLMTNFV